jgi:hypothetical protein
MRRSVRAFLAPAVAALVGCAPTPANPSDIKKYEVVVPGRDSLGQALAAELARAGLRVRREPRGGAPSPAVLVAYEFTEPGPDGRRWLQARLFHARSSVLLAAARLATDSLPPGARDQARLLVAALLAPPDTALTIVEPGS